MICMIIEKKKDLRVISPAGARQVMGAGIMDIPAPGLSPQPQSRPGGKAISVRPLGFLGLIELGMPHSA